MEKDIKDYREKELKNYVIVNILLMLAVTGQINRILDAIGAENIWNAVDAVIGSGLLSAVVYIYVFLVDALVSGQFKDKMIWPMAGLPGNRVFSDIKKENKDTRFTTKAVLEKYSNVYESIREVDVETRRKIENAAWYKAYQENEKSALVFVSQRDWLLCRDMFVMTLWIIVGFVVVCVYLKMPVSCSMMNILFAEGAVTWIAAKVKSVRYVYNVIAKDVHKKADFELQRDDITLKDTDNHKH